MSGAFGLGVGGRGACVRISMAVVAVLTAFLAATASAAQQRGLSIFISADMEGVTGVVTSDQLGPAGFEYARFREFMTQEVLAAIDGARRGGATRVLVADSHGNGENLLIDRFPEDVEIVRSWPRPLGMMHGIDSTFDGAIFIGYHSATTNPEGVRAHTMSSANYHGVFINGEAAAESRVNAAIAGHFGVPIILVAGDNAAVAEVRELVGDVEEAVVKHAISFHSARTLTPAAGQKLIAARAERAVRRIRDFRPFQPNRPLTLVLRFKSYRPSQILAFLPNVERTDAHSIRFIAKDAVELSRFLQFVGAYSAGLDP